MGSILNSSKELQSILETIRSQNKRITLCHGVFDLLHPGHLEHFSQAAGVGDVLVVSVTSDRHVNKGPGRPVFDLKTRMLALSRIVGIDFVISSDSSNAIANIEQIKPDFYVKGAEYENSSKDLTGMIEREREAVEKHGGKLFYRRLYFKQYEINK